MLTPTTSPLSPCASLDGLPPAQRAGRVFLPALAPFPVASWPLAGLLPVLDINGALTEALIAQRPFRGLAPVAGIFACDPFLRLADMAGTLRHAGITEVVNFPTVQCFEGDTAAALAAVGYRAEAEFRVLLQLLERGFSPIACATGRSAVDLALALGLRRILLHPGLTAPRDPLRWWGELAGHIAIEGGQALAWKSPGEAPSDVRAQVSSPRRRIRL